MSTEPALAQMIFNITNNIFGDGTNIAAGTHIGQRSVVQRGDLESLRAEATRLGLQSVDSDEYVEIVKSESDLHGSRLSNFLDRVRTGSIHLGTGIAVDVVAGALIEAAKQFLGLS
ncbi:hypothetical protein G3T36_05470 [Diaminobutyricibacter tongyongensis]|uniref:Uncharacterized protein n=1 Tax=Leifsonia tongyongensis TaxID=1268043 RepID=A0A6L9XVN6_9MICO|nr:hypothetical protein [Diaminobutyricibacter tongyongensis]NEN05315.1 hypothetical protein [Diaminobutyricibacter tongyongensis]